MEEIETLANGAKQSALAYRYDLVDIDTFLPVQTLTTLEVAIWFGHSAAEGIYKGRYPVGDLQVCFENIEELLPKSGVTVCDIDTGIINTLAEVLAEGSRKYGDRNWLGIPVASHINHMLNHLYRYAEGDESEPHLPHALTRCYMALHIAKNETNNKWASDSESATEV